MYKKMLIKIFYLCFFFSYSTLAQPSTLLHTPHCLFSCPVSANIAGEVLVREIFTIQNNTETKFADWVAYKVDAVNFGKSRTRYWKKDPDLSPDATLSKEDYKLANSKIGVDRGHLAPLATFSANEYWSYANLLSNIAPQKSDFNRGIWKKLESRIRKISKDNDLSLFLITGTLYGDQKLQLPYARLTHEIPEEFYKIIYIPSENGIEYISFSIPQEFNDKVFCDYVVDVATLEKNSGYQFFSTTEFVITSEWLKTELGC